MSSPTLQFKCAVITGGGEGIGFALAKWLLSLNKTVIIMGRTESKLVSASASLNNCSYYTLDTGSIPSIAPFLEKLTNEHPEIDCLADQEININIRGPMHLAIGLLPHLKSKQNPVIVNISSVLGFIPFSIVNPVYNGTKAWVHFWSMNLRTQLKGTRVRVVKIVPPTVSTDLHRERTDPDDNKEKNQAALSVEEFVEDVAEQWGKGAGVIGAGSARQVVERWEREFGGEYEAAAEKFAGTK